MYLEIRILWRFIDGTHEEENRKSISKTPNPKDIELGQLVGFRNHNDQLKNLLPIREGNSAEEDQDDNNTLPAAALSLHSSIFTSQSRVEKRPEKDLKGTPIWTYPQKKLYWVMTWLRFFSMPQKICMVSLTIPNREQKTNPIAERAEYKPKSRQKENPL